MLRGVIVLLILAATGAVGSYVWLRHYLASAELRQSIESHLAQHLRAAVHIQPLRWDGFQVRSDELHIAQSGQSLHLLRLQTGLSPSTLLRGQWSISPSRIGHLQAQLDLRALTTDGLTPTIDAPTPTTPPLGPDAAPGWMPRAYQLHSLCIEDIDATVVSRNGDFSLRGSRAELQQTNRWDQTQWRLQSGRLQLPYVTIPALQLQHANVSLQGSSLYLTDSAWRLFDNASLQLFGEAQLADNTWSIDGKLSDLACADVLPADWKQKISGQLESDFHVVRSRNATELSGQVALRQGRITALPILDTLAAYTDTQRLRSIAFDQAECDVAWRPGELLLRRIQLQSNGLMRIEGGLEFRRSSDVGPFSLSGNLRLGLSPGLLSAIPGAEEDVFAPGERGLIWATVTIGGTSEAPTEDLSARLLAAASQRMLNNLPKLGIQALQQGNQWLNNAQPTLQHAEKIGEQALQQAEKTLQQSQRVLDSAAQGLLDLTLPHQLLPADGAAAPAPDSKRK